jgi:hypothetical protein
LASNVAGGNANTDHTPALVDLWLVCYVVW